ncbi:MAG: hypothetical protein R3234_00260 [Thermoanaerobaculia bacterium]|nr:hypothetical protein [Thermoanaerobaculia bacterium]
MSETSEPRDLPREESQKGHEPWDSEIRFGTLLGLGLGLFGLVVLCAVGMYFLFQSFRGWQEAQQGETPVMQRPRDVIPGAQLLATPEKTLAEVRSQTESALSSYGWVDEDEGIAHIPIERAIEILTERGLPTRPELGPGDLETVPGPDATREIEERPASTEEESMAPAMDAEDAG